jgi:ATP-dependent exoDNAse (exonuclease V) alpha subunit
MLFLCYQIATKQSRMSKSKVKKEKNLSPKKEFRSHIAEQLKTALNGLEEKLEKKELESRIKKAVKLLTAGVKMKPAKPVKAKPVKKEEPPIEPGSD